MRLRLSVNYSAEAAEIAQIQELPSRRSGSVRSPLIFVGLIGIAFLIAGIWLFVSQFHTLNTWQSVEARSLRAEVINFNKANRDWYRGEVEFEYTVEMRDFQTPVSFRTASTSRDGVAASLEPYAVGTLHTIYYDPSNPYDILLNVGMNFQFFLLPIIFTAVGLLLVPVCVLLFRFLRPEYCAKCGAEVLSEYRYCAACDQPLYVQRNINKDDWQLKIRRQKQNSTRLFRLLTLFFGLPGVVTLIIGLVLAVKAYTVASVWPAAQAVVQSSEVERGRSLDGMGFYQLRVRFLYNDNGWKRIGDARSAYTSGNFGWIQKKLTDYSPASTHTIHYNPDKPNQFNFGTHEGVLFWMPAIGVSAFGLIFATIGVASLLASLRPACPQCSRSARKSDTYCWDCGSPLLPAGAPSE